MFTSKRKSLFLFIVILLLSTLLISGCKSKQDTQVPKSLEELNGSKVSVLMGSIQDVKATKLCPNSEIMRFNSVPEALAAVENGLADYVIVDSVAIVGAGLSERGMQLDFCLNDFMPIASAFRFDEKELCEKYNEFLAEIKQEPVLKEMQGRWLTDKAQISTMPPIDVPSTGTPLKIGMLINDFPLSFIKDGEWAGYEVELMYRFGVYIGRPIEIVGYEFAAILAALSTNKIDMITSCLAITEERSKNVLFSDPYYQCQNVCVGRSIDNNTQGNSDLWGKIKKGFQNNLIAEKRWKLLLDGLWETIVISFFAILLGTVFGSIICALRMSRRKICRGFAIGYIEIMRGIPILVFLMVMFYIVFAPTKVTATWVAIIAFAMNFGAYVSEMFRTGIQGVDHGQVEAGRALGFSKRSTFVNFILPQALRNVFPIFKGESISLIKNTSIVGYIAIQDLTKASDIIRSRTFDAFFPLIVITILYFILAWLLGLGLDYLHKKTTGR